MLTFGSLFAGIGGFDRGLELAGMRCLWQCEIDPYAVRVLEKHWPDVLRVRDIRDVNAGTVPAVDIVCGGFPCQDISYAGRGAGIDGERSGLWSEMFRVIRELRPRYALVENVPALLARGLDRVLGDLAACGYDAEWDCIPASAVGAPHQRDRIWLVAYPQGECRSGEPRVAAPQRSLVGSGSGAGRGDQPRRAAPGVRLMGSGISGRDGCSGEVEPHSDADRGRLEVRSQLNGEPQEDPADGHPRGRHADRLRDEVADAESAGLEGAGLPGRPALNGSTVGDADEFGCDGRSGELGPAGRREPSDPGWWATEPDVGRVAHGVPARVDRLRGLGNAVVPQIAEWIGRRILDYERGLT